jgi:HEPN domain-containing protein/predicted nucleotidyltransferase
MTVDASPRPSDLLQRLGVALHGASLSFPILGAVVFGSVSSGRSHAESDVDLLVVAGQLPAKRHRRGRQILELKALFPGLPIDVLLLTPEESDSNFANHNPLFLDIAEDGIVLVDRDGRLTRALDATRRYIGERRLTRIAGGWKFPVEAGVATTLSRVSNEDFSRAMLIEAERDLESGDRLSHTDLWDRAVYHYQQATEKAVKAVLIALGVFQRTHLVGAILRRVAAEEPGVPKEWHGRLAELSALSEQLEPEVTLSRYPGIIDDSLWLPSREYEAEDATAAREKARRATGLAADFLVDWFSPPRR